MSIEIRWEGGLYAPRVVCDWCGEPIEEARQGNMLWDRGRPEVQHFTHKACNYAYETKHGRMMWQPLGAFLYFLSGNTKVTDKDEDHARLLAGIR